MSRSPSRALLACVLLVSVLGGCDKLHLGNDSAPSSRLPSARELRRISYMSQSEGPGGRRLFDKLGQARSCRDLTIAMRWNRPPDVKSGPFNEKMVYLTSGIPANLPNQSEVFVVGTIEHGQSLSSGGWGWTLKLKDGTELQAIEQAEYWQREEQSQQEGSPAAVVKPYARGRKLCAHGVYQGEIGRALNGNGKVPLVSVLFAIDRRR